MNSFTSVPSSVNEANSSSTTGDCCQYLCQATHQTIIFKQTNTLVSMFSIFNSESSYGYFLLAHLTPPHGRVGQWCRGDPQY